MKDPLKPTPQVTGEQSNFHQWTQAEGETIAQYVVELMTGAFSVTILMKRVPTDSS